MTLLAAVVMVVICSVVWGGFFLFVLRALRAEAGASPGHVD